MVQTASTVILAWRKIKKKITPRASAVLYSFLRHTRKSRSRCRFIHLRIIFLSFQGFGQLNCVAPYFTLVNFVMFGSFFKSPTSSLLLEANPALRSTLAMAGQGAYLFKPQASKAMRFRNKRYMQLGRRERFRWLAGLSETRRRPSHAGGVSGSTRISGVAVLTGRSFCRWSGTFPRRSHAAASRHG